MSDTWYRDPLPPYEDFEGGLWTVDGVCLNPVHTCEPPAWAYELARVDMEADIAMTFLDA